MIRLHHCHQTRSMRSLWLLEELGIPFELKSYGFDAAQANFQDANVDLTTLSDYENLLEQALHTNFIDSKQLKTLQTWREDPGNWMVA